MCAFDSLLQSLFEQFAFGKFCHILGYADIAVVKMHQFYVLFVLSGAKDESDGLVFTFCHIIFFEPAQIQFHLSLVSGLKLSELQVNGDKTTQTAVIEQQVYIIVFVVDRYAFLACHEGEVVAQLRNESLQVCNNGTFKILLGIIAVQPEKIQHVRVLKHEVDRHLAFVAQFINVVLYDSLRLLGYGRTLVQHPVYLGFERTFRPTLVGSHGEVESPLKFVVDCYNLQKMRP